MANSELINRIEDLQLGDRLDLTQTNTWGAAGHIIQQITEKAIKIDDTWVPKSQIVGISYGHKFKGIEEGITECKQIILNKWFDDKLCREAEKNAVWGF